MVDRSPISVRVDGVGGPHGSDGLAPLLTALRAALDGSGPALAPTTTGDASDATGGPTAVPVPRDVALVVPTSGSTGAPRRVLLDRGALAASARATHERLGGPGRWVLALPLTHVAGLQVLVRSVVGGTEPVVAAVHRGFEPVHLADAVGQALASASRTGREGGRLYTSVVPTQLHRIVATLDRGRLPGRLASLAHLDAVLVGGAGTPPTLLDRARGAGLRVVTTYGMTETCGGCVYDGSPLTGVRVALDDGVVRIAGPVLARGYLDRDDAAFTVDADGTRWFRTRDHGVLSDGRLDVLGRVDDVLVTGGVKVAPAAVEDVIARLPGVAAVCVVGVPDAEWGAAVTAVVVPDGTGGPALADLRALVTRTLGPAAAPRHLVLVEALPLTASGKPDRHAAGRLAAAGAPGQKG